MDLYKDQATREAVEAAIKENPAGFWYIFGHGNPDVITGQGLKAIIDDQNIALWDGAWIHVLSCEVFERLGLKFKHGSGYNRTYYFYGAGWPNGAAEQYFRSDHEFALAVWTKKASKAEAQAALKKAYTDWFNQGLMGNDYMIWDRDGHVITGDPNAHWTSGPGIAHVEALYKFRDGIWLSLGYMAPGDNDNYTLKWKFPEEGFCRLKYVATDTDGTIKEKETGEFTIKFPESPIEIVPIFPVGGEVIQARTAEIKTSVRYLGQ
jgi:hypothetical protein